jgi:hypothetical protein
MAKATHAQWDKAKALYEAGKSLREIELETGISKSTVADRAENDKNGAWIKGKTVQLIQDVVRVSERIGQLNRTEADVVAKEVKKAVDVDAIGDAWDMIIGHAANASKRILARPDATSNDVLNIVKAGETSKVTLGKLPRFSPTQNAVKVEVYMVQNVQKQLVVLRQQKLLHLLNKKAKE